MKQVFLSAALAVSLCAPAYAAQFTNTGDARYENPVAEDGFVPNTAVRDSDTDQTVALPIILTGDHAQYDNVSGDFYADGDVVVTQGNQVIHTNHVHGNLKTGDVWLEQGGELKEQGTTTKAQWAYYNFNSKTGELKQLSGKSRKDYFYAPHGTIEPDKIVMDQGATTSRCPAVEHPRCLEVKAKTIEVYPHDKIVAKDVQVFVRGKHIYSRDIWETSLSGKSKERILPHFGFKDDSKGTYINISYERNLSEKTKVYADLDYYSKDGFRPLYGVSHDERNFTVTFENGWFEDDDEWIKKQTDIRLDYKPHHFSDKLPLSYSGYYEHGLWKNDDTGKRSWHTEYGAFLNHDRIYMFGGNTTLDLTIGKKWTKESLDDTSSSTNVYYATLGQKITDKWRTWAGYYREDFTTDLFNYGQPDMPVELRNGLEYKFDDKNTATIINRYDLDGHRNYETDYRFTHRFCCWQLSIELQDEHYKDDKSVEIKYEFVNW